MIIETLVYFLASSNKWNVNSGHPMNISQNMQQNQPKGQQRVSQQKSNS